MAQTTVNIQIDKDVKQNAERVLNDMGLSLSSAITVFLTKISIENRIPFEIPEDSFYSETNIKYLKNVINGIENGTRPLAEHDLLEVSE